MLSARGGRPKRPACAPSKLSDPTPVPTRPLTVTKSRLVPPPYDASAHATFVAEVHDALLHKADGSSDTVPVRSIELKFSPKSVTETPVHGAMFDGLTHVTAGAAHNRCDTLHAARCGRPKQSACAPSKQSDSNPVPTTLVTVITGRLVPPPYDASLHATIVAEVHDTERHETDSSSDALGLTSIEMKLSPKTATEPPPVGTMFDGPAQVTTGAATERRVTLLAARGDRRAHRRS
jgi:hypothetical protein